MSEKQFIAETFQEAVDQAKTELGDEIVIVKHEEIIQSGFFSGDKKMVQVTVSDDPPATEHVIEKPKILVKKEEKREELVDDKTQDVEELFDLKAAALRGTTYISRELNQLNRYLKKMVLPDLPDSYQRVYEGLMASGMDPDDVRELVKDVFSKLNMRTRETYKMILNSTKLLALRKFYPSRFTLESEGQKIKAFIGPTGSGKTMSLMKLAIHPDIFGKKQTAIISTDCYRMAANASLKSFSKITSIPVAEVKSVADLQNQLVRFKSKDVILIDTPGRSPYFPDYLTEISQYLAVSEEIDPILVLSGAADIRDIKQYYEFYEKLNPTGVIITKLDETRRLGKIISMVHAMGLPIDFFGTGQSVPNDIRTGSGDFIWSKILNFFNAEEL